MSAAWGQGMRRETEDEQEIGLFGGKCEFSKHIIDCCAYRSGKKDLF